MKNYLLPVLALVASQGLFAQVENGNFDNWDKMILFHHPVMETTTMSSNYETFFKDGSLNVNSVDGPTGKAMRIESTMVNDEVVPGYFLTGELPQQDGEGLDFEGGFPVHDPEITGISMDVRHNIPESSPGFIIVQFKRAGVELEAGNMGPGTIMVPLSGESDWQQIEVAFPEPFEFGADACVVGVASANLLGDDLTFPEGAFVEIDNLDFVNGASHIAGGDFESWSFVMPIWVPENVLVEVDPFDPRFEQTEDSYTGPYALALNTRGAEDWVEASKAIFAGGDMDNTEPNIALSDEHSMISFAYKYEAEDDMALATVTFFNEAQEGVFNEVFQKTIELEPNDAYTTVEYSFADDMSGSFAEATHITIAFESSAWLEGNMPQVGSVLKVDDVALSGVLRTPIISSYPEPAITASPNPTMLRVEFDLQSVRTGFFRVFNTQGRQVDIRQFQQQQRVVYDMTHMPTGQYIFRFQHNGGVQVIQVMKL